MWRLRQAKITPSELLAQEVASTLREVISVRQPKAHFLLSRSEFWGRCHLVTTNWRDEDASQIFVDGFARCCHWNSWKVYAEAIEDGLSLWFGYAFLGSSWTHHAWCMLRGRIVESTAPFLIFYGAELNHEEHEFCERKYGKIDLIGNRDLEVFTFVDERRRIVPYDPDKYAHTIGRERDSRTSAIKEGLGR